jgi:Mannose-6-phosphate receptor
MVPRTGEGDKSCVFVPKDTEEGKELLGPVINLTAVAALGMQNITGIKTPADTYDYSFTLCEALDPSVGCPAGAAGCQKTQMYFVWTTIGMFDQMTATGIPAGGPESQSEESDLNNLVQMEGGVRLRFDGGANSRSFVIDMVCDNTLDKDEVVSPKYVDMKNSPETGSFVYSFVWASPHACPIEQTGLSLGSVILIILAVLVFVYFAGGIAFQVLVRKERGCPDVVPNSSFWVALPGLVADGARFIGAKTCCRGQGGQQMYSTLED